jgi:hypothetical protein
MMIVNVTLTAILLLAEYFCHCAIALWPLLSLAVLSLRKYKHSQCTQRTHCTLLFHYLYAHVATVAAIVTLHRPKGVHRVRGFMFLENRLDGDDTDNMKMRLDCNLRTMLETKYSYSGAHQFNAQSALPESNSIAKLFAEWLKNMNG